MHRQTCTLALCFVQSSLQIVTKLLSVWCTLQLPAFTELLQPFPKVQGWMARVSRSTQPHRNDVNSFALQVCPTTRSCSAQCTAGKALIAYEGGSRLILIRQSWQKQKADNRDSHIETMVAFLERLLIKPRLDPESGCSMHQGR